jgi:membrane fusion protein (multidrug efflux system)
VAGRNQSYRATIAAIEPAVTVETRSLRLRAMAPNASQELLPGSFAQVEVALNEIPDAILVPPLAVVPGNQQQTVFVFKDGKVQERRVEIGLRTADAVQIVKGLSAGEEVVTSGVLQLRSGMTILPRRSLPGQPAGTPEDTNRLTVTIRESAQ